MGSGFLTASSYESVASGTIGTASAVAWGISVAAGVGTVYRSDRLDFHASILSVCLSKVFFLENTMTSGTETISGTISFRHGNTGDGGTGGGNWISADTSSLASVGSSATKAAVISGTAAREWKVDLKSTAGTQTYKLVVQGISPS